MNSRSRIYLKEAVSSIQKGHLTLENAAQKYGIAPEEIKMAIKNYCLNGNIGEPESSLMKGFHNIINILSLKILFNKIAPTYDCEKEIDRFKFKFAYALVSFLLVALGAAALSFPGFFSPVNSTAKTVFEEKVDRVLTVSSKRSKSVDSEVKYLNKFYSRINKILDESNSKDSKMLKDEFKKRLNYINSIEKDEMTQKAASFTDTETKDPRSKSDEIYSNLYKAASEKDKSNYMAKTLKERIDGGYLKEYSKKIAAGRFVRPSTPQANSANAIINKTNNTAAMACSEEMKPLIEDAVQAEQPKSFSKRANAASDYETASAEKPGDLKEVARNASIEKKTEPLKSYKFNKSQSKNYESLKDKLYIINKYKRETILKKGLVKRDLKFKYPIAEMIFVPDRVKYNESLKKIATNKDYNARDIRITEDRG